MRGTTVIGAMMMAGAIGGLGGVGGCAARPAGGGDLVVQRGAEGVVERGLIMGSAKQGAVEVKHVTYVPRGYDPKTAWPCIVFLHGMGESGTDGLKQSAQGLGQAILWNQAAWPFIVIMPQKPDANQQWEAYDDAVMAMLAEAKAKYNIDDSRIYLTGLSQGGHGTWELGARHADVWAAIAPICGYGAFGADRKPDPAAAESIAKRVAKLPIWAFHGDADNVVIPEHTRVIEAALKQAGAADTKFSYYPGVNHNSWDRAYREEKDRGGIAAWFLTHRKTK